MATEKPHLISTSQRLRVEQYIFWLERFAIFLLCILICILCSLRSSSLSQDTTTTVAFSSVVLAFTLAIIILFNFTHFLCFNPTMVVPRNINPNGPNPSVKTKANLPYTQADRLNDDRAFFWIERLLISFCFLMLLLRFTKTTTGATFAAAMAIFFLVSNFTYFILFLESEKLYVQKNNTNSLKGTNEAPKGSQSCNSYASASGSSVDLKKAKLVEVKKNEKVISESKAICDQQALEKAEDELRKLKTEYENLKASHAEELRKAIEQCKGKYKMKLKEKKYKLDEEYSEIIDEWHEEYGKFLEESKKYYQMKLNKKKDKREEGLKKMKDEHEENCRKWEEEKIHLVAELVAARASSEHYRCLLQGGDYSFSN